MNDFYKNNKKLVWISAAGIALIAILYFTGGNGDASTAARTRPARS